MPPGTPDLWGLFDLDHPLDTTFARRMYRFGERTCRTPHRDTALPGRRTRLLQILKAPDDPEDSFSPVETRTRIYSPPPPVSEPVPDIG